MSRTLLSLTVILGFTLFTACQKDYTCVCTGESNGQTVVETLTVQGLTQSNANDKCEDESYTNTDDVVLTCGI